MKKAKINDLVDKIKLLTNPNVDDNLIITLISAVESKILIRIKRYKKDIDSLDNVNEAIFYLIIDLVVARYNRIGAEGMKSEAMANRSYTYIEEYEEKKIDDLVKDLYADDDDGQVKHGDFLFIWDMTHLLK